MHHLPAVLQRDNEPAGERQSADNYSPSPDKRQHGPDYCVSSTLGQMLTWAASLHPCFLFTSVQENCFTFKTSNRSCCIYTSSATSSLSFSISQATVSCEESTFPTSGSVPAVRLERGTGLKLEIISLAAPNSSSKRITRDLANF